MKKIALVLLIALVGMSMIIAQVDTNKIEVETHFNVAAPDAANFLKVNGKTDQLDATTGASKFKATSSFNAWYRDAANKTTLPAGIRGLFLYPIAPDSTRTGDDFKISKAANGVITINYIHQGSAYQIVTDNKGVFDIQKGDSKMAPGIAPRVDGKLQDIDAKYLKAGGDPKKMADVDWSKITLGPDKPAADVGRVYAGSLQFNLDKNILTIKGTLNNTKK